MPSRVIAQAIAHRIQSTKTATEPDIDFSISPTGSCVAIWQNSVAISQVRQSYSCHNGAARTPTPRIYAPPIAMNPAAKKSELVIIVTLIAITALLALSFVIS